MFRSNIPIQNSISLPVTNMIRPSSLVTNANGIKTQKKFFDELMEKLEKISPGISANL